MMQRRGKNEVQVQRGTRSDPATRSRTSGSVFFFLCALEGGHERSTGFCHVTKTPAAAVRSRWSEVSTDPLVKVARPVPFDLGFKGLLLPRAPKATRESKADCDESPHQNVTARGQNVLSERRRGTFEVLSHFFALWLPGTCQPPGGRRGGLISRPHHVPGRTSCRWRMENGLRLCQTARTLVTSELHLLAEGEGGGPPGLGLVCSHLVEGKQRQLSHCLITECLFAKEIPPLHVRPRRGAGTIASVGLY